MKVFLFILVSILTVSLGHAEDCLNEITSLADANGVNLKDLGLWQTDSNWMMDAGPLARVCEHPKMKTRWSAKMKAICAAATNDTIALGKSIQNGIDQNFFCTNLSPIGRISKHITDMAIRGGNYEAAKLLIENGIYSELKFDPVNPGIGTSTLVMAARQGRKNLLELLIHQGASVDAVEIGHTKRVDETGLSAALRAFVWQGVTEDEVYESAYYLLKEGANPNVLVSIDGSVLHSYISNSGHSCAICLPERNSILEAMLRYFGANPNLEIKHTSFIGNSVWAAAYEGSLKALQTVIKFGGDPTYVDPWGNSTFTAAKMCRGGPCQQKAEFLCSKNPQIKGCTR